MMTGVGVILGTAAYMSPEQAKGRPADKRSDIWAFGCVLYEMLTGKRAFEGEDVSDTLAAVLRGEPDWTRIPPDVPSRFVWASQRCLEKDRNKRIGDVSTVRFVINEAAVLALTGGTTTPRDIPPTPLWRRASPVFAGAMLAAVIAGGAMWIVMRPPASSPAVVRFQISLDEVSYLAVMVFVWLRYPLTDRRSRTRLAADRVWRLRRFSACTLRSIGDDEARPIPGTEVERVVGSPVFSPDGQSIAFYVGLAAGVLSRAKGMLKRIGLNGGTAVTLCEIDLPLGISWNRDGILFGQLSKGIMRVSANGGEPEQLIPVKHGEILQGPQMLPDGDNLLFTRGEYAATRLDLPMISGTRHRLLCSRSTPANEKRWSKAEVTPGFFRTGHLVYAVGGTLRSVPFDPKRLEVTGRPTPVVQGIGRSRFGPTRERGPPISACRIPARSYTSPVRCRYRRHRRKISRSSTGTVAWNC